MSTPVDTAGATATLVALISSYADNKGALGRRYGEWAVSAPTIEAAVAAATMAQDELGHARATYPVLDKLGHPRPEDGLDTSDALPMLAQELPDWASTIAANLVVDGVLKTSWVASARQLGRAACPARPQVLQEEGAHRVHAEAWAKRLCRAGGSDADLLLRRIAEAWEQAARWLGPDDDPGYRAAVAAGLGDPSAGARMARRPAGRRGMRGRAAGAHGLVGMGRDATLVRCPFCDSADVEPVAQWGGQIITRQCRCRTCNIYFEAVRDDFAGPGAGEPDAESPR